MSGVSLEVALTSVHDHLTAARLPHAFGGAIALAFCIPEPRATKDIDVNVFVGPGATDEVLTALPAGVRIVDRNRRELEGDGQSRLHWDDVPIDVFLSNTWFHGFAEARVRSVPFADLSDLPVLGCAELAVFKAFFARPKDELDVAMMASHGTIDLSGLRQVVARLLGPDDRAQFFERVEDIVSRM